MTPFSAHSVSQIRHHLRQEEDNVCYSTGNETSTTVTARCPWKVY